MKSYSNDELRKLQCIQKEILTHVHNICVDNNIEYFIIAGTLLGAVRHKGFIPWDDDIDIGMTRDNYEKFNKIASKFLAEGYELQNIYEDKNCPFAYSKVRKKNTKFIEYCNRNLEMMNGIYIDIFPFDNVPDNEFERKIHYKKVKLILKLFIYNSTPDITQEPVNLSLKIKFLLRRIIHNILKRIPKKYLFNILDNEMKKYRNTNTKYKAMLLNGVYMWESISKDTLYPLIQLEFEKNKYFAPNDYNQYLTDVYGDYLKLPPENKRIGHSPYILEF
ncbi:LicD family protein [Clostridium perfringens]|nr:LicD family protein [Clostridium perfringens]EIW6615508.1 LicD family protein [Clostridium perfringens]MDK0871768.1 LicD family protein [Clostridium perfringens]